ncbi:MAG: ABC transporter ATP-binding protein [Alphaproteobacteria bacterium]|nr:ABC transporter ATP-binding protein [Alphaproteobacteria bacterium]
MYFDFRLWQFTVGVRGRVALAVALGFLASMAAIARLALLGWLLARLYAGAPNVELILLGGAILGAILLRAILQYAKDMVAHETAARVQATIRRRLFDHINRLGPAFVNQERTGDVLVSLVEGVDQLEVYFGQYLPQVAIAILTPIALFAALAWLDSAVATVFLVAALATLAAPTVFHRWNRRQSVRRRDAYGGFAAEFLDSIQGLATLKAFGQSAARARLLAHRAREVFRTTMWVLMTNALTHGITVAGIAIGAGFAVALGAWRVQAGEMELGVLLVVLLLGTEAFRPLRELSNLLHYGMVGLSAAAGIGTLLEARPTVGEVPAARPLDRAGFRPTVTFEGVVFAYPGGRRATHAALDFHVGAGERVAIVGPSGAGKSSIVKLLLRLYDPQAGVVRLGGHDLRGLSFADIRRQIALVSQDTFLFHGTVEDNLRFGKPDATETELIAAARAANAHDFVAALPEGYGTVIGDRGVLLSGGQRQRIAIARALLRDAPILILDEALSSVDAESEWLIQDALDHLMLGRTTLIFAHRLSSVIGADRILVLESGRIAESGTHGELIQRPGPYRRLMAEQAQDALHQPPVPANRGRAASGEPPDHTTALQPTEAIRAAEAMGWLATMGALLRLVAPWWAKITLTLILGILRVVSLIGVAVAGALAVAALKNGQPFDQWLILLAILAPMTALLHWLESWVSHDVAFRLLAEMRVDLFDQLDRLAPAYLTRRRTGDLVGLATQDVELVEYFFAHTIAPAFVAVLVPGAVLATLLAYGWPLALAVAPLLLAVGVSPFLARRHLDRVAGGSREALGELNAVAVDNVQGLADIVAFQQENRRGALAARLGTHYSKARMGFFRDITVQKVLLDAAIGLGGLAVIGVGAVMVAGGQLEGAMLPMLTLLAMAAFLPVYEIAEVGRRLADSLASTRRLHAVRHEPVPVTDGPGVPKAPRQADSPALAFSQVTFTYPGRARPALADVTLAIAAGGTVALVGPSGAGKTSVAQLLLRFWDPQAGSVRLDGHDLRDYALDDLRRRVALVAQDTYLFNDTLRANILIAKPDASEAELLAAIEQAALTDFVASLPEGLQTRVGERGAQLSGGQRQRVAIARAFLKDAPILILDEATSHLDAVSELAIRTALDRLMAHRTTLVIAHRLSTVRGADLILVLDEGRLIESGSHEALLARNGLYAHLVARQLAGAAAAE